MRVPGLLAKTKISIVKTIGVETFLLKKGAHILTLSTSIISYICIEIISFCFLTTIYSVKIPVSQIYFRDTQAKINGGGCIGSWKY